MAIIQTVACDVCGKQKRSVNHWWIGYVSGAHGYMLSEFDESLARNPEVNSFCGQECAIQGINRWMQAKQAA